MTISVFVLSAFKEPHISTSSLSVATLKSLDWPFEMHKIPVLWCALVEDRYGKMVILSLAAS